MSKTDTIEKYWTTESGYKAICVARNLGFRCGYVEIPEEEVKHLRVKKPKDYKSYPIQCHGGLTYCGPSYSYWNKDLGFEENNNIWIGFDCFHYGDKIDPELINSVDGILLEDVYDVGTIRTLDFVMNECENIGKQLILLKKVKK